MKEEKIIVEGKVTQNLPGADFRVELTSGVMITGYVAGKMRSKIIVLLGDTVRIEVSPYDLTRGRIIYRLNVARDD